MAPNPYIEIVPPFIVDANGNSLSAQGAENSPDWPIFIRASLIGKVHEIRHYPNPNWKLSNYPGPFLYGGPFKQKHFEKVKTDLEQWAFFQALNTSFGAEPGFFVASQKVLIAPDTGVTKWPANSQFRWFWHSEPSASPKYRIVNMPGFAGGRLERVA